MQIVKWIIIGFFVFLPFGVGAQQNTDEYLQSRLNYLKQYPKDKQTLRELGLYYLNKADYEQAIVYGTQLFDIGYAEQDYYGAVVYAHTCLGQANTMKGNVSLAYNHLHQARVLGESSKNDSVLCSIYNGLGLYACNIQKDLYQAITYFFKGIDAAKRCGYTRLHSILLANLAEIYYLQNDTTGLKYALESYTISHELKDLFLVFFSSLTTAHLYYLKGDYAEALRYLRESEFLMVQNGYLDRANVYNLFGYILHRQGRDKEAVEYFRKSLELEAASHTSSMLNGYLGYAEILVEQKRYEQAEELLKNGIKMSYQQSNAVFRSDLLKALSDCYEKSGKTIEALTLFKQYQQETDSLYNAEKGRAVEELRIRYDVERQENQLKLQELELLAKERRLYLLILGLVCLLVAFTLLYYSYHKKDKLYLAIVKQNQESIRREQLLQNKIAEQQSVLDNQPVSLPQVEKYAASSLTDEKKQYLFLQLESLLRDKKIYSDNLLTKDKVAEMLNTNRTYLSQIINEQTKQTFTQFVNGFRAQEAVRLLSDPQNQTPLKAIASELGFNSMTTFYNLFQAATGMTPTQYRNKVQQLQKDNQ